MSSYSIIGAIRERIITDPSLNASFPGGFHVNELPADAGLDYPALVARYLKTSFTYMTTGGYPENVQQKQWIERPLIELWIECLKAEQGELLKAPLHARLVDQPLLLTDGYYMQLWFDDFYLHPETGRNAAGKKQYSWCAKLLTDIHRVV